MSEELRDRMKAIGYPDFEVTPGEEQVPMLYVEGHLICAVHYALTLSQESLQELVQETVK